jgi:hypothetical protein
MEARRSQRLAILFLAQRSQLAMVGMRWKAETAKSDCLKCGE